MNKEYVENYWKLTEQILVTKTKIKSFIFLILLMMIWPVFPAIIEEHIYLYFFTFIFCLLIIGMELFVINKNIDKYYPVYFQCILEYTLVISMLISSSLILFMIKQYVLIAIFFLMWLLVIFIRKNIVQYNLNKNAYKNGWPIMFEFCGVGVSGILIFGVRPIISKCINSNEQAFLLMACIIYFLVILISFLDNSLHQIYFARKYLDTDCIRIKD